MACNKLVITSGQVALTAATPKTPVMITAPANIAVKVTGYRVSFDGATSTAVPPYIEYGRPSTTGTFTSQTPRKMDPGRAETVQTTGGVNASAEPTWTSVVDEGHFLAAYGGLFEEFKTFDNPIVVPGAGRWGIRVTAAAAVNCSATIFFEE